MSNIEEKRMCDIVPFIWNPEMEMQDVPSGYEMGMSYNILTTVISAGTIPLIYINYLISEYDKLHNMSAFTLVKVADDCMYYFAGGLELVIHETCTKNYAKCVLNKQYGQLYHKEGLLSDKRKCILIVVADANIKDDTTRRISLLYLQNGISPITNDHPISKLFDFTPTVFTSQIHVDTQKIDPLALIAEELKYRNMNEAAKRMYKIRQKQTDINAEEDSEVDEGDDNIRALDIISKAPSDMVSPLLVLWDQNRDIKDGISNIYRDIRTLFEKIDSLK